VIGRRRDIRRIDAHERSTALVAASPQAPEPEHQPIAWPDVHPSSRLWSLHVHRLSQLRQLDLLQILREVATVVVCEEIPKEVYRSFVYASLASIAQINP
jgi:hypothetical protein